jgi:hypothetical protein
MLSLLVDCLFDYVNFISMRFANLFLLGPLLVALNLVEGAQTAVWGGSCLVGMEWCVVFGIQFIVVGCTLFACWWVLWAGCVRWLWV